MTATEIGDAIMLTRGRPFGEVSVGDELPTTTIPLTPTLVITTALATRDFEEVHHDVDVARAKGLDNIFLNILTTNGLCQRLVVDWGGPDTIVRRSSVRLGVPALAGDDLVLSGVVTAVEPGDAGGDVEVEVTGMVTGGRHCKARIRVTLPDQPSSVGVQRNPGGDA